MQTTRQWMVTHEWMVKGNRQTEWIENRGILLWLAFYAGGLGGGMYLVSLFFNSLWGMLAGWLIVTALKGTFHFLYLGQPTRFWRLVMHPQTSWLSRGLLFVFGFAGFGFLQIVLSVYLPEQTTFILVLKILAGVLALCVATYTGFVLNRVKGVPFWDSPILPVLFVACGILGGFGLTIALGLFIQGVNLAAAEMGSRIMLVINVLLISTYLFMVSRKDTTGKQSVLFQIRGGISPLFWTCVVAFGIVVPALKAVYSIFAGEAAAFILLTGVICEITGGVMLRYCVLKSAIYKPIVLPIILK